MIHEVDEALRELVRTEVGGPDVDVVFDAPTRDWAARRNQPTVNLYLYDIREDLRRRPAGYLEHRDPENTALVVRKPAPRYFKLSYLVTAWVQRPEDEHRLLDSLLRAFLRYDALPDDLVTGLLAEPGLVVPVTVGLPPPEDRAFADVWSALGGELKPSLDIVVVAPVDTGVVFEVGPPVTDGAYVDMSDIVDGGKDEGRHHHTPPPPSNGSSAAPAKPGKAGTATKPRKRGRP